MGDFNVRSDSVNVEQIMEQIRARIREKRGVDYTEEQIRELAGVKLQKFLDPRGVRSDLLEEFRKAQPPYVPPDLPNYAFEDSTLFDSHRGVVRVIRRLLRPILKLFFNPNPLIRALNIQAQLNTMMAEREARREASQRASESLTYELTHNLVLEATRLGIEVKNLAMRVESLSSRLEFNERRARALESAVVYRPSPEDVGGGGESARETRDSGTGGREAARFAPEARPPFQRGPSSDRAGQPQQPPQFQETQHPSQFVQPAQPPQGGQRQQGDTRPGEGPGQRSRRRRRRRGRRGGAPAALVVGAAPPPAGGAPPAQSVPVPEPDESPGGSDITSAASGTPERSSVPHTPSPEGGKAPEAGQATSGLPDDPP
jgi:hypothetical protein